MLKQDHFTFRLFFTETDDVMLEFPLYFTVIWNFPFFLNFGSVTASLPFLDDDSEYVFSFLPPEYTDTVPEGPETPGALMTIVAPSFFFFLTLEAFRVMDAVDDAFVTVSRCVADVEFLIYGLVASNTAVIDRVPPASEVGRFIAAAPEELTALLPIVLPSARK